MPSRTIKESLCISENVNLLTAEEERLFIRLIVKADDYGRYDGRASVVRGAVFPLKEEVTTSIVEKWLQRLASQEIDLIRFYEDRGVRYLYFVNWITHQGKPRADKSRYPQPTPENTMPSLAGAGICAQVFADSLDLRSSIFGSRSSDLDLRSTSHRATPDGEAKPEKKKPRRKIAYSDEFKAFWQAYPAHRRDHKEKAFQLFEAAIEDSATAEEITQSVIAHTNSSKWQEEEGRYVPGIIKFLEGERWKVPVAAGPRISEKERKSMGVIQSYLERHGGQDGE